jgi:hypothetical protein
MLDIFQLSGYSSCCRRSAGAAVGGNRERNSNGADHCVPPEAPALSTSSPPLATQVRSRRRSSFERVDPCVTPRPPAPSTSRRAHRGDPRVWRLLFVRGAIRLCSIAAAAGPFERRKSAAASTPASFFSQNLEIAQSPRKKISKDFTALGPGRPEGWRVDRSRPITQTLELVSGAPLKSTGEAPSTWSAIRERRIYEAVVVDPH